MSFFYNSGCAFHGITCCVALFRVQILL